MAQQKAWTLASGARFAREARISTVAHMRETQTAREWQESQLISALQVLIEHFDDYATAVATLLGGLGYQPPYPADSREAAERILADEARYLTEADLYILTPEMCDVVVAAAMTLTLKDLELLGADDVPSRTGLVVLPHPVIVSAINGEPSDLRALAWHAPVPLLVATDESSPAREVDSVRVSGYDDTRGPVQQDSFRLYSSRAHQRGEPLPPLLVDGIRCIPFHMDRGDVSNVESVGKIARRMSAQSRAVAQAMGLDEEPFKEGTYVPGSPIEDPDDHFNARFLYAFWRLCDQRVADVARDQAGHAATLAAQRAQVDPDVRVVRLRRTEKPREGAKEGAREWQHRWVVKMHKVRQWYPSEQRHKVIYRGPYVKGPDDKPLLGGETVWALVR